MHLSKINFVNFSSNINFGKIENPIKENTNIPKFNAGRTITYDEIVKFHESITKNKNRDSISFGFYTTPQDIGSGLPILGLPITRVGDKAKGEMLKEIKRLLSNKSTLSSDERKMLRYLYQQESEIRCYRG